MGEITDVDACDCLSRVYENEGSRKGRSDILALSLLARIDAIEKAETIQDIVVQKQFRFHNLHSVGKQKLDGYFAIDVKTKRIHGE